MSAPHTPMTRITQFQKMSINGYACKVLWQREKKHHKNLRAYKRINLLQLIVKSCVLLPLLMLSLLLTVPKSGAQNRAIDSNDVSDFTPPLQYGFSDSSIQRISDSVFRLPYAHQPDSLRLYFWKTASALGIKGHYQRALQLYSYANSLAPLHQVTDTAYRRYLTLVLYNNLCANYVNMGHYDIGIKWLTRALDMVGEQEQYNDKIYYILLSNMGIALFNNGDTSHARSYYERAWAWVSRHGDSSLKKEVLLYRAMAAPQADALPMLADLLRLTRQQPGDAFRLMAEAELGSRLMALGQTDSALQLLQNAYNHMKRGNDIAYGVDIFTARRLGAAYLSLRQYNKAATLLLEAYQLAEARGDVYNLHSLADHLFQLYKVTGEKDAALHFAEELNRWKDHVHQRDRLTAIGQMDVKYRTAEKDLNIARKQAHIQQQDQQLQRSRVWIISISLLCGLLVLSAVLLYFIYRYLHKLQTKDMEITRLKAMMDGEEKARNTIATGLHDGIGGLLAAAKMKLSQEIPEGERYRQGLSLLDDAYRELRHTAHNLSPLILKQEGLTSALREFCRKVSDPTRTMFHFETHGQLLATDPEWALSLYRIVQELAHNIMKHADASEAWIQLNATDDTLQIIVQDNGKGLPQQLKGSGIGLQHLTDRVQLMNGMIDIDSRPGTGTTFYLDFQWRKE